MHRDRNERPDQSPGEDEAAMSLPAHQAHYRHPAHALVEQILQRLKIRHRLDDVRQQLDLGLLRDQPPDVEIVRGTVLDDS